MYTTASVPQASRARYWNEVYSSRFADVTFSPVDREGFEAELRIAAIGPISIARIQSRPTDIVRTRSHIDRSSGRLLATSYAVALDPWIGDSSAVGSRRSDARRFIEAHLKDPDLTPRVVAGALRVSPRYLRMLFAEEQKTVSAYILRRRLEACAKQISSALWRGRTITNIAFACGFNSTAHFTRVFRNHFRLTPGQYRETHLPGASALS
ncbi:MAG: helix-turn-helix domain-containing protein [Gammaproteobacteria bacterium]